MCLRVVTLAVIVGSFYCISLGVGSIGGFFDLCIFVLILEVFGYERDKDYR
nr:MAG TPA: hypothetical protein [Caudoviricetes sp.]